MNRIGTELKHFLVVHRVHILLLFPGAIGWTLLHESAHALAVVLQGGLVSNFVWLPSPANWGHVNYHFAPTQSYSVMVLALAPYGLWLLMIGIAVALAWWRTYSFNLASTIFVWLYVAPMADMANTALLYVLGRWNDFYLAFGPPTDLSVICAIIGTGIALLGTFYLQRRLYRERALSAAAYTFCSLSVLAAIIVIGGGGLRLLAKN